MRSHNDGVEAQRVILRLHDESAGYAVSPHRVPLATQAAGQWVRVERYVQGEVEDLGGSDRVNAHIGLASGERLTVDTDRAMLRDDKVNRLYKTSMLRISAEYNVATEQHRNARLIEFVDYAPKFDESEFERLTTVGRQAWKSVSNPSAWVDALRGHGE